MCTSPINIIRGAAAVATLGGSELAIRGVDAALDAINPEAETVNYRGDKLSDSDKSDLDRQNPAVRANMLLNWLSGGTPKAVNPGKTYGDAEKMSGVIAKGAAGQGMSGLFGAGLLVGDLTPKDVALGEEEPYKAGPVPKGVATSVPPIPVVSSGGNTGQPGTGPMGPTQSVPNRGPGDVYPLTGVGG